MAEVESYNPAVHPHASPRTAGLDTRLRELCGSRLCTVVKSGAVGATGALAVALHFS